MDLQQLEQQVRQYTEGLQGLEKADQLEQSLRDFRLSLVQQWLSHSGNEEGFPDDQVRKQFRILRMAGLHDLPRNPDEEIVAKSARKIWKTEGSAPGLMAAMLLLQPYEFPLPDHFTHIPETLRTEFAEFLITSPGVFHNEGDADRYADYLKKAVKLFHKALVTENGFAGSEAVHTVFVNQANFIQFYFNEKNLRKTYRRRAEIMETWALNQGAQLAHLFPLLPPRPMGRKIKVGFLSAHFIPQTEVFLVLSYFDRLPKDLFSVTLYSLNQTDHPLEQFCRSRVDGFVHLPDGAYPAKVERIRSDELDILFIGTNTSAVSNPITIMAMFRMARIHVISENSPVSTGFTHTDYYLSSMFNEPDSHAQDAYTEQLYRVPGMLNYYAYHMDQTPKTVQMDRNTLNIPDEAVVYFSGANFYKLLPELSRYWAEILQKVPDSYLILIPFNPNWSHRYLSQPFIQRLRTHMEAAGVDFDRIRILNRLPSRADVHGLMAVCDVYLDSFPYAGACSLIDPLTVGLPIVCLGGKTMRGNLAAAMLRGAGLEEMIVSSPKSYIRKAIDLGTDTTLRQRYREMIRDSLTRYNPFFDTTACGVKVGAAFLDMVDQCHLDQVRLLQRSTDDLLEQAKHLIHTLMKDKNPYLRNLAGTELIRLWIMPYFRSLRNLTQPPRIMDVGTGSGRFSLPFLNAGCRAHVQVLDASHAARLQPLVARFADRARVTVGSGDSDVVLSEQVDLIRMAAGYQGKLRLEDENHRPRIVMREYNAATVDSMTDQLATFTGNGYMGVHLDYGPDSSQAPNPANRLSAMFVGMDQNPLTENRAGVMVWFLQDDHYFPATLIRLLQSFMPARQRLGKDDSK